jgi:hypothetical protein
VLAIGYLVIRPGLTTVDLGAKPQTPPSVPLHAPDLWS